jgi:hypothetical protein
MLRTILILSILQLPRKTNKILDPKSHTVLHQLWHQLIGNGEFQLSFSQKHFFAAEKVLITFEQNMSCMASSHLAYTFEKGELPNS